jgi:hypothetical protein
MSHELGFLALISVVSLFILVSILRSAARHLSLRRLVRTLHLLNGTLGGALEPEGLTRRPVLSFARRGRRWRLDFSFREGQYHCGRMAVDLGRSSPGSLHIIPEGIGERFLQVFGTQDLTVGDARFDEEYVVRARPESLAARVFALPRRDQVIAAVRRIDRSQRPSIDLDRNTLGIQARGVVADLSGLNALIQTTDDFLDFLFAPAEIPSPLPAGVEIGDLGIAPGGECPVCGTPMNQKTVRCELCRTPHHAECWDYMGRCSTFACGGKRSVKAPLSGHERGAAAS